GQAGEQVLAEVTEVVVVGAGQEPREGSTHVGLPGARPGPDVAGSEGQAVASPVRRAAGPGREGAGDAQCTPLPPARQGAGAPLSERPGLVRRTSGPRRARRRPLRSPRQAACCASRLATSTSDANVCGSRTARSARTLRSRSTPA